MLNGFWITRKCFSNELSELFYSIVLAAEEILLEEKIAQKLFIKITHPCVIPYQYAVIVFCEIEEFQFLTILDVDIAI